MVNTRAMPAGFVSCSEGGACEFWGYTALTLAVLCDVLLLFYKSISIMGEFSRCFMTKSKSKEVGLEGKGRKWRENFLSLRWSLWKKGLWVARCALSPPPEKLVVLLVSVGINNADCRCARDKVGNGTEWLKHTHTHTHLLLIMALCTFLHYLHAKPASCPP